LKEKEGGGEEDLLFKLGIRFYSSFNYFFLFFFHFFPSSSSFEHNVSYRVFQKLIQHGIIL
jgi:hypothetical protein